MTLTSFLRGRAFWLLLLAGFFILAAWRPLNVPDEGRYPEIAREMLRSGDFVTPRLDGIVFLDKPALYYWLEAASMAVFGINNFAIRFFPALFGFLGCVLVAWTGRRLWNARAGQLAALTLATMPLWLGASQYANLDLMVAVWVSAALCCFLVGWQQQDRRLLLVAWACAGLAVLTKGLLGIVLPIMVIGAGIALANLWRQIPRLRLLLGPLVLLAIVLPWYLLVQRANPGFFHYFFVYQQFERYTSSGFNNELPAWFYLPVLAVGMLGWLYFLVPGWWRYGREAWRARRVSPVALWLWLWPLLVLVFFSLPRAKIVGYILPVLPPLALVLGQQLDRWLSAGTDSADSARRERVLARFATGSALLVLALLLVAIPYSAKPSARDIVTELKKHLQPGDLVVLYDDYPQDVPVYLDARSPVLVASDFSPQRMDESDNWRRDFRYGLQNQANARDILIDFDAFAKTWHGPQRVWVIGRSGKLDALRAESGTVFVAQQGKFTLLGNQPLPSP